MATKNPRLEKLIKAFCEAPGAERNLYDSLKKLLTDPASPSRCDVGILEDTDWFPNELQASLLRLIKSAIVVNLDDATSKRRSKPLHIDKLGERLKLA